MRTVFGAITVVLLAAIAYLLYANYVGGNKPLATTLDQPGDLLSLTPPSPVPVPPPAAPVPAPVVHAPIVPSPAPVVENNAPGKRTHVVQPGESLWTISKSYYGTGDLHHKIGEANKLKNDRIRVGQLLIIPADRSVAGAARKLPPAMSTDVASVEVPAPTEAPSEEAATPPVNDEEQSSSVVEPMPPTLSIQFLGVE